MMTKFMIAVCLVALVGLSLSVNLYPRGCLFSEDGLYHRECEKGTHAYTTGCGYMTLPATSDSPNPVTDTRGKICDYSACYCDPPTVRDTATDKCVSFEECVKKEKEN